MTPGVLQLAQPEWLWLLPLAAIIWLAGNILGRHDEHTGLSSASSFSNLRFLHPLIGLLPERSRRSRPSMPRLLVYGLVISCLALAMSGPVRTGHQLPDPPRERDIVFIVDTSVSMILRDYVLDGERIDRLSLLKGLLDRFAQGLQGERLAVIVFGDQAYTLVPLTRDQHLIRRMLTRIETTMAGRNSAVGDGIALAVKEAGEHPGRQQLLVLLTSAHQPVGKISPRAAAALAKQAGLPLYTIAIGAASYSAEEQRISGLIYHPADVALLQQLAAHTGAKSYQAGDSLALEQAIADIEQAEYNLGESAPRYYRESLYHWPLLLGLLILSMYQFGNLLRSKP
ncbi:MAG: VWA domain-containing protein [Granulosicoccaceae bacterium]|jgi:Ca-activated chloride channel family protein